MRSLRAHCLVKRTAQSYASAYRINQPAFRNSYCSSCYSKPATDPTASKVKINVSATPKLPVPAADHRQIGIEQELFTTSIYSPGSPLFLPNGARVFNKLVEFIRAQYSLFGFQEVITPTIYKKSLWETSGHWENYADDIFSVTGRGATAERQGKELQEDEENGLKPMNCPGHCLIFASQLRSFRDLPIRFADFSPLHRNEISGSLSGLTRVRRFHQDDGHIFCRPSQVREEILKTLKFVKIVYKTFNLGPYRLALSTRPKDKYIGTTEEWDTAEAALRGALDGSKQEWTINEGDGAFYGPKIDIILKDSDGREHQTATIQLDFQLPKRFNLQYQAPAPDLEQKGLTTTDHKLLAKSGPVQPVMVHRAVLGSLERFFALLIEHYDSHWPFWLNPRQIALITVKDTPEILDYTRSILRKLQNDRSENDLYQRDLPRSRSNITFTIDIDDSPRRMGKKISEAKRKRYGVIVVVGSTNVQNETLTADLSGIANQEFKNKLKGLISETEGQLSEQITMSEDKLGDKFRAVELKIEDLRNLLKILEETYAL